MGVIRSIRLGTYTIWAESTLHDMKNNYLNGGAAYTGRTISPTYTITLVSPATPVPERFWYHTGEWPADRRYLCHRYRYRVYRGNRGLVRYNAGPV